MTMGEQCASPLISRLIGAARTGDKNGEPPKFIRYSPRCEKDGFPFHSIDPILSI
jgi:hypothetical protein